MDQRHNPYSRPQDRPLIQNPNHQTLSQQPPSQPHLYHPPSSQQPPYQIPPSDPFQRRAPDPFLPNPQSQRSGSYGLSSGRDAIPASHSERPALGPPWTSTAGSTQNASSTHHHSGPPPPPALSQALGGPPTASYAHEHVRRRSIGGHSPPRYYASTASSEVPPPLAAFMNRQMPPPSPSQQPPPNPAYQGPRGPPPPPTFTTGRELPALGAAPRHGAGMSISSILGDTPATQPQGHPHHGSPAGNSQSPPSGSQPPASPHRRGHSITSKLEYQRRRPQTPDRHHLPAGLRAAEGASYSANSSPAHFANARRSPEFARTGPPLFQQTYQPTGPPRPYQGLPNEGHERDLLRLLDERIPPRPNSQPAGLAAPPPREGVPRDHALPFGIRAAFAQYQPPERREELHPPVTSAYEPSPPSRDRPITVEPLSHAYSPPNYMRDVPAKDRQKEEPRRDYAGKEDYTAPFRTGFRNQYYQPRGAVPTPEAPRSHPQMINPFDRPREGQPPYITHDRPIPASIDHLGQGDRRTSDPHAQIGEGHYRNLLQEHQPLAMQRSRSSLGIEGKRGRASPLPQAVQGAQMQPTGVGSDPNIKSEFGRIFQGLGSGLGHGSLTPSRGSPMPQRHPPNAEVDPIVLSDGEAPRSGSVLKRHKRVKEEDGRYDEDGRGTSLGPGARGSKRSKTGHHHHLHQHNHPHHHHIHGHLHRPEEALAGPSAASAHHHHHIHTSHHHHHTPLAPRAQAQTPIVPIPKPTVHVASQAVMDLVKDRSRKHLGSELYEPKIELPPAAMASHTDDKFGYFLKYTPSRVFEEKDLNCTFTIRIPRYYLTKEARENIHRNRSLEGTEVYTDDSDPIAMLIHCGWLRGEWPDDVDVDMLDLPPAPLDDAVVDEEYTKPPDVPLLPPEGKDLQLTMLILPPLKAYQGCVRYGLRSRDWESGDQHDGFSWMVQKIRWVDESGSSGVKRNGKARRERIENQRNEAAIALLGLATTGRIGVAAA